MCPANYRYPRILVFQAFSPHASDFYNMSRAAPCRTHKSPTELNSSVMCAAINIISHSQGSLSQTCILVALESQANLSYISKP